MMRQIIQPLQHQIKIDKFNEGMFGKERDRLMKFDSLTVLDYIKTSIEILMQMKLEEEKIGGDQNGDKVQRISKKPSTSTQNFDHQSETPQSSSVRSIELPPKEYETQLQQYESEVRNHIKCEQQLKLHIEVLQEKIDELEKEKITMLAEHETLIKELEEKFKQQYREIIIAKDKDLETLQSDLKVAQSKIMHQSQLIEKQKALQIQVQNQQHQHQQLILQHSQNSQTQQQHQNLLNNMNQNSQLAQSSSSQNQRVNTSQSKSPPSHSNIMSSNSKKVKNAQKGKSPYLNDCFYKLIGNASNASGASASNNGQASSNNSSAKSNRKSSQINNNAQDISISEAQPTSIPSKKIKPANQNSLAGNTLQENMKIIAAIQRMRIGNQPGLNLNQGIINPQSQSQQQHKKNKSFSHYGNTSASSAGRSITQSSHYNPSDFQVGANLWSVQDISNISNMNNSFQNERVNQTVDGISNQNNQKMVLIGNNGGRIQIIENLNINSQKNNSQIFQTQQPVDQNQQQLFTRVNHGDVETYQRKKSSKKTKSNKRDNSSHSGRGSSNSHLGQPSSFTNNASMGSNIHHRVYSIDMIENQNEIGNLLAANQQDFQKNFQSNQIIQNASMQRNTVDSKQKKQIQSQIPNQRGRPKSQMADKSIFVRIVRLFNLLSAALMIIDAINRFFDFQRQSDPFFFLLTFYLFGFAALLVMAEIRYKRVIAYVEFLKSRIGKGLYVILVGLLIFDENRKFDMFVGITLFLNGVFNIIVSCMRDEIPDDNLYEKAEMYDPESQTEDLTQDPQTPRQTIEHQPTLQQQQTVKRSPSQKSEEKQQAAKQEVQFVYKLGAEQDKQNIPPAGYSSKQVPNKFSRGQAYQKKK
ncbi:UNKNOWN [Stylonychia lemnae]|uniref:Transmembrane protein n=1 Tax=Stylonychia lemnae TaxID=5949 RepID=A0A078B5J4_STYLE|nr:UNKNOWN [Stylonychia lemnae]|eukprot:CDW89795.1 UNKNOWN [Stylonychia lemnae]